MKQAPETPSLAANGKQQPTDGEAALRDDFEVWERRNQGAFRTETKEKFVSDEGLEVKRVYTPLDLAESGFDYRNDLGLPGAYPYTRAISPTMYRSNLWRISQYSGYATPEECNDLWRAQVGSGLNYIYIAYDLPTQLGYDPDTRSSSKPPTFASRRMSRTSRARAAGPKSGPGMDLPARRNNSFSWWRKKMMPPAARPMAAMNNRSWTGKTTRFISSPNK